MALERAERGELADEDRGGLFSSGKARLLFLALALLAGIGYLAYTAFPGNTVFYLNVSELEARTKAGEVKPGQVVRVVGKLVPGSFQRADGSTVATFTLRDLEDPSRLIKAVYDGPLPDTFFNPMSQIVLEGPYNPDDEVFRAQNVIVKCPTKYQAAEGQEG